MSGALPIVLSMLFTKIFGTPMWYGLFIIWGMSLVIAYVATYILNSYIPWIFDLRIYLIKNKNYKNN